MRVLVIGGTGFIGPPVVQRLIRLGHEVTVFHRGKHETDIPPDLKHIHGSWKDQSDFAAQLPQFSEKIRHLSPDVVLYMTPADAPDSLAVIQVCRGRVGRLVCISSIDVYRVFGRLHRTELGPPDPIPLSEVAPLREKLYAFSSDHEKIQVERTVLAESDLPGIILRLPMVYGPRDPYHRLFYWLKRMDDMRSVILIDEGLADWRWSRGYVDNVATAIVLAVTDNRAAGRIYNVAEAEGLAMAQWVREVGEAAGWRGEIIVVPRAQFPQELLWADLDTAHHWVVDTTRIRHELGYDEPVPREEALKRTVDWERAHPPEQIDPKQFDYEAEDRLLARLRHGCE